MRPSNTDDRVTTDCVCVNERERERERKRERTCSV